MGTVSQHYSSIEVVPVKLHSPTLPHSKAQKNGIGSLSFLASSMEDKQREITIILQHINVLTADHTEFEPSCTSKTDIVTWWKYWMPAVRSFSENSQPR